MQGQSDTYIFSSLSLFLNLQLAIENALRYIPPKWHAVLAPEFAEELKNDGHIYMRRFRPTYRMYARPINEYPARCVQARAIMHMIQNNLDPRVAQFPEELVTVGHLPEWMTSAPRR